MTEQVTNQNLAQEEIKSAHADAQATTIETVQEQGNLREPATTYLAHDLQRAAEWYLTHEQSISWCLSCHQMGHTAEKCPSIGVEVQEMDRRRLPRTLHARALFGRLTVVTQFVLLVMTREAQLADYRSCIKDRDALLLRIHRRIKNNLRRMDLDLGLRVITQFNVLVDNMATWLFEAPSRFAQDAFTLCARPDESLLTFLDRAFITDDDVQITDKIKRIKAELRETQGNHEAQWNKFVSGMPSMLNRISSSPRIDPTDRSWTCKAFRVIQRIQPCFVPSDMCIIRFKYPNADEVLRIEGVELDVDWTSTISSD